MWRVVDNQRAPEVAAERGQVFDKDLVNRGAMVPKEAVTKEREKGVRMRGHCPSVYFAYVSLSLFLSLSLFPALSAVLSVYVSLFLYRSAFLLFSPFSPERCFFLLLSIYCLFLCVLS